MNVTHSGPRNEDVHSSKLNHRHVLRSFNQNRLPGQHPVLAGHPEAGLNHDIGENHNPPVSALLSASGSQSCVFCEPSAIFRFLSQLKVHQILWFCSNSFHSHATYCSVLFTQLPSILQAILALAKIKKNTGAGRDATKLSSNNFAINQAVPEFQLHISCLKTASEHSSLFVQYALYCRED